jgi:hypothetical protein
MSRVHSFTDALEFSQSLEDAPWWFDVYRKAFPGVISATSVRKDGWAQRGGIDRVITLESGRIINIDEKVRKEVWPDILLERWSDEIAKVPGWIQKNLACEFIAYAFVPNSTCYLLPTLTLQRAWRLNGRAWISEYGERRSQSSEYGRTWTTVSTPVPINVLFEAVADAMQIIWQTAIQNPGENQRSNVGVIGGDLPLFNWRRPAE